MSSFSLSCTALMGTNKAGTLKPDADGYYTVVLGALDVYNSIGAFYPEASARELFERSSSLMRRVSSGNLRGEYGHPRMEPGMSDDAFLARVRDIKEQCVSHHIRKVTVDYTTHRNKQGQPVITIVGEVKPCGPFGPALKEQLENKSEDVCFSIRSLTNDRYEGGRLMKHLKVIVTWDYVNEPGLDVARKWNSPSLEGMVDLPGSEIKFTFDDFKVKMKNPGRVGVGMESSGGVSFEEFASAISESSGALPASASW